MSQIKKSASFRLFSEKGNSAQSRANALLPQRLSLFPFHVTHKLKSGYYCHNPLSQPQFQATNFSARVANRSRKRGEKSDATFFFGRTHFLECEQKNKSHSFLQICSVLRKLINLFRGLPIFLQREIYGRSFVWFKEEVEICSFKGTLKSLVAVGIFRATLDWVFIVELWWKMSSFSLIHNDVLIRRKFHSSAYGERRKSL